MNSLRKHWHPFAHLLPAAVLVVAGTVVVVASGADPALIGTLVMLGVMAAFMAWLLLGPSGGRR